MHKYFKKFNKFKGKRKVYIQNYKVKNMKIKLKNYYRKALLRKKKEFLENNQRYKL